VAHERAASYHDRAVLVDERAAEFWAARGDDERAARLRVAAGKHREAAQEQREKAEEYR
jgi:hypothetical protein